MKANDEITSLDTLQKIIERYEIVYSGRLFFRGENAEYSGRIPGILRDDGYVEHEADFFSELMKMHQQEFLQESEFIDRLALMQHYGAPTRLLDMSINPYVSLYFACEEGKDEEPGYLYMYVQKPLEKTDISVKLLSWMACNKWKSLEDVCKQFRIKYACPISTEQVRILIEKPIFISQDGFTGSSNKRIVAQQGTFVICGETEDTGKWKMVSLDTIPPVLTLRITPEYKEKLRQELNIYDINTGSIYKDLGSASRFLRAKYGRHVDEINEDDYDITINDRASLPYRRSKEMQMVMKRHRSIEYIYQALKAEILKLQEDADVVWAYVSMSQKDYVSGNYRTMMQWVNPQWRYKDKFSPTPFKHIGDNGFSWQDNLSTSIMSDYDNDNLFSQPEEYIFVSAYTLFSKAKEVYTAFANAWNGQDKGALEKVVSDSAADVDYFNSEWDNIGYPIDKEVKTFLNHFSNFFLGLSSIKASLNNPNYKFLVPQQFKYMERDIAEIEEKKGWWRKKIKKTDAELEKVVPLSIHKEKLSFLQTIPMADNPMEIIDIFGGITSDGRLSVRVETNLFDEAELMMTARNLSTNKLLGSAKAKVRDGKVLFEPVGAVESVKSGHPINLSITLPASGSQSIGFVKKAGIQYENMFHMELLQGMKRWDFMP